MGIRISKEEMYTLWETSRIEATLYRQALTDALNGNIEWLSDFRAMKDGCEYRYGVSRLWAAHGGLFIRAFKQDCSASKDYSVHYLEDFRNTERLDLRREEDYHLLQSLDCAFRLQRNAAVNGEGLLRSVAVDAQ